MPYSSQYVYYSSLTMNHQTFVDVAFHAGIYVMLVQSFSPHFRWREDFEAFTEAIDGKRVTDDLYEVELDEGPRLIIGWCKRVEKYMSVELPGTL